MRAVFYEQCKAYWTSSILLNIHIIAWSCYSCWMTHDLFHKNKNIFIDLGIHLNLNLPKLHATHHFSAMIMMFDTMDNYNTEYTKQLHINLMKNAYCATNHKDEFVQMMWWLKCKEKIMCHDKYVNW